MPITTPIFQADQVPLAQDVGESLNWMFENGYLLNADVGAGKTEATMEAAIATNAGALQSDRQDMQGRAVRALQYGAALSILTTANIQAATTVADLVAITGADANKKTPMILE